MSRRRHPGVLPVERGRGRSRAARVCEGCPVTNECLEYALLHRIEQGVWGGASERERRRILRARRRCRSRHRLTIATCPAARRTPVRSSACPEPPVGTKLRVRYEEAEHCVDAQTQSEYARRLAHMLNEGVLQDAVAAGLEEQGQFEIDVLDLPRRAGVRRAATRAARRNPLIRRGPYDDRTRRPDATTRDGGDPPHRARIQTFAASVGPAFADYLVCGRIGAPGFWRSPECC